MGACLNILLRREGVELLERVWDDVEFERGGEC
jgi:hypothetical protein